MKIMLDQIATEMRREYLQNWRKKNPEKVRQYNKDYWNRKAAKAKQEAEQNEHKTDQIQDR